MTWGKKTGGKDFGLGGAAGPGRPALPSDIKDARSLNRQEVERTINSFLYMNKVDIEKKLSDKTTTMLEALVGSIILKALATGDQNRMNFLIEQVLGSLPKNYNIRNYSELTDEAIDQKLKNLTDEFHKTLPDETGE